jgi:hypothetical protein
MTTRTVSLEDPDSAKPPKADTPARRWRRIRPRVPAGGLARDLAAVGLYLVAALWTTLHLWRDVTGRVLSSNRGDNTYFEWMLARGARLFTHPENPFFSHAMNAPVGVNMMANTSIMGLSLPLAPVTLLFGPVASFALLLVLALALTSAAWYFVFSRHLVRSRLAAFLGALVCGFAPAMIAHSSGQPNIVAQFAIPFLALAALRLAARPVWQGLLLGLLVTYQAFINEEVLLLAVLAIGLFVLVYAAMDRARAAREFRRYLTGLVIAAVTAGLLLGYPLYCQFFGPQHYHGLPFSPNAYPLDLFAYVTYAQESVGGARRALLGASPNEENASFGWTLLLLILLVVVLLWRRERVVRAATVTLLVFAAISLGPTIMINDHSTGVPGPFRLLGKVPPFDLAVSGRFALAVSPMLGILLALGCQWAIDVTPRLRTAGVPWTPIWLAVAAVALVPMLPTPIPAVDRAPVPGFISSGQWRAYVPPGRTIVSVPLPAYRNSDPILWQASEGLDYPIPRGYFLGPASATDSQAIFGAPPRPTSSKLFAISVLPLQPRPYLVGDTPLGMLVTPSDGDQAAAIEIVNAADRRQALADLRYWRAAVVVLPPVDNEEELWRATSDLLGFTPTWTNGVWLWDVRTLV